MKHTRKKLNKQKNRNLKKTIEKRYNILYIETIVLMVILMFFLFKTQIIDNKYYEEKVKEKEKTIIYGSSAPRGRIYDRNGKLLVDNKPVKTITYQKQNNISTKEEIEIAYKLSEYIEVDYSKLNQDDLKEFWMIQNKEEAKKKITDDEYKKYKERKLTSDDIHKLKLERISDEELSIYDNLDKEAIYIYNLMNEGYSYSEKIIKKNNVTDREYALVGENIGLLKGVNTKIDWEREYLYDSFRTIIGNISNIPYELKDYYLSLGYNLNDIVGISYLEYQYEDILKGTKNEYHLLNNGNIKLVKEGKRGNDIVLSIDIDLQNEIDKILEEQLMLTKNEPNTQNYNRSFVIVSDPNTGEVLAMSGKQIVNVNGEYKIYDYTVGLFTSPVVVGSVIKGASHIVGYNTGALKLGELRYDECIKIMNTPIKCSWTYLGLLDDISALKYSSNTYQFQTAIKVGGGNYTYDGPLLLNENAFDIYRNTFSEFGLGIKTQIDLPNENIGYKGNSNLPGFLLDYSIGQYDTYTALQLNQYANTIANGGNRLKPRLLKAVYSPNKEGLTDLLYETKIEVLNKVNTDTKYIDRVKEGFKAVLDYNGTGYGYIDLIYNPAGKTGTSESFVDTNKDGVIDTPTLTNTFVGFAPYDNPKVSFTIVSPDYYTYNDYSNYQSLVNMRIASLVSKKYFEFYK